MPIIDSKLNLYSSDTFFNTVHTRLYIPLHPWPRSLSTRIATQYNGCCICANCGDVNHEDSDRKQLASMVWHQSFPTLYLSKITNDSLTGHSG